MILFAATALVLSSAITPADTAPADPVAETTTASETAVTPVPAATPPPPLPSVIDKPNAYQEVGVLFGQVQTLDNEDLPGSTLQEFGIWAAMGPAGRVWSGTGYFLRGSGSAGFWRVQTTEAAIGMRWARTHGVLRPYAESGWAYGSTTWSVPYYGSVTGHGTGPWGGVGLSAVVSPRVSVAVGIRTSVLPGSEAGGSEELVMGGLHSGLSAALRF